jgi:hypothetical protein
LHKLLIGILILMAAPAHADILNVPSEYATIQLAFDASSPGDEIVLAPGIYKEQAYTNTQGITLTGSGVDTTTISGDLDGTGSNSTIGPEFNISFGNVLIQDITFTGFDTAINTQGFGNVEILNCRFSGNDEGICSWIAEGSTSVQDCYFENNNDVGIRIDSSSPGPHSVRGCTFTNSPYGGADVSNTSIESCTFDNIGTAISGSDISISDSHVVNNNLGLRTTGMLTVHNTNFRDNNGNHFDGGSAINHSGACVISDSNFENNSTTDSFGGAINASGGPFTMSNCAFIGNSCGDTSDSRPSSYGGAASLSCSSIEITDCHFESNISYSTGALNISASQDSSIRGCTFVKNGFQGAFNGSQLLVNGGAICAEGGNFAIEDCVFRENIATQGGAVVHQGGSVFLRNSYFYANNAESQGGAIAIGDKSPVVGCTFVGNSAGVCGAIGWYIAGPATFPAVYNSVFVDNSASRFGSIMPAFASGSLPLYNSIVYTNRRFRNFVAINYGNPQIFFPVPSNSAIFYENDGARFIRPPSDGGDGWGDEPATPEIDEGANDDFGDLRLTASSPCIDAGDNLAIPADTSDLDGDGDIGEPITELFDLNGAPRFVDIKSVANAYPGNKFGGPVDLGPYEYQEASCLADVNGDGAVTPTDFTAWINAFNNNLPECDQNGDGNCTPTDFTAWIANFNAGC